MKWLAVGTSLAAGMVLGCVSEPTMPPASGAPPSAISGDRRTAISGDRRTAAPGFFWLPPIAKAPTFTGTFDGSLGPVVEICIWNGTACGVPIATFTTETGTGSETVRVVPEDELYKVNWRTKQFGLDPALIYRIRVLVGGTELGHADVDVVATGRELKSVNEAGFVGVLNGQTLPIKFRIEQGAVSVDYTLALTPAALTIAQSATGTATVTLTRTSFTGAVTLSLGNAPAGVTGAFVPAAPTGTSATLTVSVGAAVAPGVYNLTVDGSATAGSRSTPLTLTVTAAGPPPPLVSLGAAATYGILAGTTVTCVVGGAVTGDVGVSPGSAVTGFPPCTLTGTLNAANAAAATAQVDLTTAFNQLAALTCGTTLSADLGGMTLAPGVYCATAGQGLTGVLTLDGGGDPNATFVIKVGSALTVAGSVNLIGGADAKNVFWHIGSSATIGTGSAMQGNLVALTSITLVDAATLLGRALARTGAVTMGSNNAISLP